MKLIELLKVMDGDISFKVYLRDACGDGATWQVLPYEIHELFDSEVRLLACTDYGLCIYVSTEKSPQE